MITMKKPKMSQEPALLSQKFPEQLLSHDGNGATRAALSGESPRTSKTLAVI
jgi:hypothetical protein